MQWDNILLTLLIGGVVTQFFNVVFGKGANKELVGTVKEMATTLHTMQTELSVLGVEVKQAVDSISKNDGEHEKILEQVNDHEARLRILEEKRKK